MSFRIPLSPAPVYTMRPLLALLMLAPLVVLTAADAPAKKPNVIVILLSLIHI